MKFFAKKHDVDMTQGKLLPQMIAFTVPIILSSVFSLLFNTADMIVVGKFLGNDAIGAVGAATSVNSMMTFFASGLASGAGVH